jgi:Carboxypeptidase regulatory-like domain
MKSFALFVLSMALFSSAFAGVETAEIGKIQFARTLTGTIVDPSDSALPGVQVLEVSSDWKAVLRTTTTDGNGRWSLAPEPGQQVYYLRFIANGFNPLQVRVELNHRKGKDLRFKLPIAT